MIVENAGAKENGFVQAQSVVQKKHTTTDNLRISV
jgi:hypothetical protein